MVMCNCCENGFQNLEQVPETEIEAADISNDYHAYIEKWIAANEEHDVCICGCCGNGEGWYGTPGEHYTKDDPPGHSGPYAYNGGLCECD